MPPYVRRRGILAATLLALGLAAAPATSSSAAVPSEATAAKSVKQEKKGKRARQAKAASKRCYRRTIRGKRRIVCTRVRTFRSRAEKGRDRTPPRLKVSAPTRLTGKVPAESCKAVASDAGGVQYVDFRVDGEKVNREREAPYTCAPTSSSGLDSTQLENGAHEIKATAADTSGNTSTTQVTVTVANPPTPTKPVAPAKPAEPSPPAQPAGPMLLNETFDDSRFSLWQSVQRAFTDRISTVEAPSGRAGKVGRFEVRGGDRWNGTARAELAFAKESVREGDIRTYKWRTMFAADYPSSPLWQDIAQWKNDGEGTPPFQIKVEGEEISLAAGWQHTWKKFWKTPLVRGQWLEFEVKMKFSVDPAKGWAEIRLNGEQVLPRTAVQNLYPNLGNYFKIGLYRSNDIQPTGVVWHDDVQILEG